MSRPKQLLNAWVIEALQEAGGAARVVDVSRRIWTSHEHEIRSDGDLLYTWQYDVRWAAHDLRRQGLLKPVKESPRNTWELIADD
jgi:hypothetical protein